MKFIPSMLHKQSGSMLILALFIIIVMTLLGLSMSSLMSSSANAIIYEVYGLRAHNAARVGLERRLEAVFSSRPADATACINETFRFDSVTGLKNCQVVTSCSSQSYNLDDGNASAFYFSSTGRCDGGQVTVSRTIKVDALERQ